jgi:hypothetical protein
MPVAGPLRLPHRTPHPPRLPRPVLDPVARLARLAAHDEPVPPAQLDDRLPNLHVIGLDAVGGERFACLEAHAGRPIGTAAEPTQREESHENRTATPRHAESGRAIG